MIATRDLLVKLGLKRPALWEMRAAVAAIREAEERGAARERQACIEAAEGERLTGETGEPEDEAYNNAIRDVVAALRARGVAEGEVAGDD